VVLEARNITGGRVHWLEGTLKGLDVGAHWVQGGVKPSGPSRSPANPVARYLHLHGVQLSPPVDVHANWTVFDASGQLPAKQVQEVLDVFQRWNEAAQGMCSSSREDLSLSDVFDRTERHINQTLPVRQQQLLRTYMAGFIGTDEAAPLQDLSCRQHFGGDYYEFDGGDSVIVDGGYSKLVHSLGDRLDIRLSSAVKHIIQHSSGGATVRLHNGQTFAASAVIVTTGVGASKRRPITFSPPLPPLQQEATSRLGFGSLTVVVLRFASTFWASPSQRWLVTHPASSWCNTSFDYPCLSGIIDPKSHNALYVRVNPGAVPLSDDETAQLAMQVVGAVFHDAPAPVETHVTRWEQEEWVWGGAGVYATVNTTAQDFTALAQRFRNISFAGEATCERMYATVHGAFVSGLREAKSLLGDTRIMPAWENLLDDSTVGLCAHSPSARREAHHWGRPHRRSMHPLLH